MNKSFACTAVYFLAAVFSTPAADRLPVVVVRSTPETSLTVASPDQALRTLRDVAGATNFIAADEFRQGRASTLRDVLDFQPGVIVQPRFGAEEARLSIRGSGIQRTFHGRGIKLLQDGLAFGEADGGFDMQAIEPLAYRYVEVFRGANALRYGAATLGGAINFVTFTGHDASLAQVRGMAGSWDTWQGQISSGAVAGPFDYYVSLTHNSTGGYRDFSQQNNQRLAANTGWRISEQLETRMFVFFAQSDSELPGALTKAQMKTNPRQAAAANKRRIDKRDFDYVRIGNKTTAQIGDSLLESTLYWAYKDLDHPIFNILTPTFATGPGTIDLVSNNLGGELRWTTEHQLLDRRNQLVLGVNPSGSWAEDTRFENLMTTEARGRKFAEGTERSLNLELYLENQLWITETFALVPGFQFAYAERNFQDRFLADGDASRDQSYTGYNPKLGFLWDATPNVRFFGNLSRSFEPPSFGEIKTFVASAGPPQFPNRLPRIITQSLKAQSATTLEVGSRGSWDRLEWDTAFYHAWIDNELLSLNDANGNPLGTINASPTLHTGLELGLRTRLGDGLLARGETLNDRDRIELRQIYNWSRFTFAHDPVYGSNQLAGIPEHLYRAEILYRHPWGLYLGPNVEWSATRFPVDHANTFFADSFAILGAKVGYESPRGFSLFIEGRNLLDATYSPTTGIVANAGGADTAQFLPGDGFALYGGFEWRY
ncbi:MAG: TonB-dependent receptor [Verrucomicrobiia bacterium]